MSFSIGIGGVSLGCSMTVCDMSQLERLTVVDANTASSSVLDKVEYPFHNVVIVALKAF